MVKNQLDDRLYPSDDSETDALTPDEHEQTDQHADRGDSLELLAPEPMPQTAAAAAPAAAAAASSSSSTRPPAEALNALKSQFAPSKWQLIRVSVNRFTYSKEYIIVYILLTALSIVTVAISLSTPKGCPHLSFYIFEIIVLVALMLEVLIRMIALRGFFWKSVWNYVDAAMMVLCAITLGLVFAGCSKAVRTGRQTSTVLLVVRNVVQIIRIIALLWRNRNNIKNRQVDIDLDNVQELGFELLPEEDDPEHIWSVTDEHDDTEQDDSR